MPPGASHSPDHQPLSGRLDDLSGDRLQLVDLEDSATWGPPTEELGFEATLAWRPVQIRLQAWDRLVMRGQIRGGHHHTGRVVRVETLDATGQRL